MNPNSIRTLLDLFEEENLKKQAIDAVQSTDDPNLLQKVVDTLKAGNIEERIKDVLSKDADSKRFIDKLADIIVAIKAPVEEKNAFLKEFPKGIVNTDLLLDGQQHTFSELVGPGFNTELFKILTQVMVSQGVGPGEVALAVLSPHVKWSGRAAGGGDIQVGNQSVEVKTSVAAGGRWINARKATMDMTSIKTNIVKAMTETLKKQGQQVDKAEPLPELPARLNPATWVETFRSRIDPSLLDATVKGMADGLFNHTNNELYQKALADGMPAQIKDAILDVGFSNYKSYSHFDGILMMDLKSEVSQYFKDYVSMKGSIKTGTTYIYAPESEAMPQVVLMDTMGKTTSDGDSQVTPTAPAEPTAQTTSADLDSQSQQRSGITARAGGAVKKLGTEKTLGRKRQR
jgi:hypothetical protein